MRSALHCRQHLTMDDLCLTLPRDGLLCPRNSGLCRTGFRRVSDRSTCKAIPCLCWSKWNIRGAPATLLQAQMGSSIFQNAPAARSRVHEHLMNLLPKCLRHSTSCLGELQSKRSPFCSLCSTRARVGEGDFKLASLPLRPRGCCRLFSTRVLNGCLCSGIRIEAEGWFQSELSSGGGL